MTLRLLNKSLNFYTLAALNIAIILIVEIAGNGVLFARTGAIHFFSLLFVLLIAVRINSRYTIAEDDVLKKFLKIQLYALLFLGLVHIVEYFALKLLGIYGHSTEGIVGLSALIGYLSWFLAAILAAEQIYKIYRRGTNLLTKILTGLITLVVLALTSIFVLFFFGIKPTVPAAVPITIAALMIISASVLIFYARKIGNIMPEIFKKFTNYMIIAVFFLIFSALFEFSEYKTEFAELLISKTQIIYITHFFFHASLSTIIIAFGKMQSVSGMYKEIE